MYHVYKVFIVYLFKTRTRPLIEAACCLKIQNYTKPEKLTFFNTKIYLLLNLLICWWPLLTLLCYCPLVVEKWDYHKLSSLCNQQLWSEYAVQDQSGNMRLLRFTSVCIIMTLDTMIQEKRFIFKLSVAVVFSPNPNLVCLILYFNQFKVDYMVKLKMYLF